jgi:nicotinamidase-related amidase
MDRKDTALVLIDIQNDYFPGGRYELLESDKANLQAKVLLEEFRKRNLPVIHVRHESIGPDANFFIPNTHGADIHPNVAPRTGETVIVKYKVSSFIDTGLESILRNSGIKQLIVCGMQTNWCVRATTLDALKKGFKVTVIKDAIAAKNIDVHQEAIKEMVENQVKLMKTEEFVKNFE